MIAAPHSAPVVAFFNFYTRWKVKRSFHEVVGAPPALDAGRPLLVIGNHFGWWDGFLPLWVNLRHWRRQYHILMLEEELARRRLFAKAGAFGIRPGTRDVVESLRHAARVLADARNVLVIYPQGRIESQFAEALRFEPGVERVLREVPSAQILFMLAVPDYGTAQPRPTLRLFFELYAPEAFGTESARQAYHAFRQRSLGQLNAETEVRHAR